MATLRDVIHIDQELCDGCGDCVTACHEGAIALVGGKAKLVSETYCDGLGDCVGECPQGAITIEKREVAPFDAEAVAAHLAARDAAAGRGALSARAPSGPAEVEPEPCGCPGAAARTFAPSPGSASVAPSPAPAASSAVHAPPAPSALRTWPVQLRLLHPGAPYLQGADLLLCADCVPFAMSDLHARFMEGRVPVVACPKLDDGQDLVARLAALCAHARPRSITVLRMMVPCCGGLAGALARAQAAAGTDVPVTVHVVEADGSVRAARAA